MRIGFGYDVHRLVEGRRLFLGGVEIQHPKGLEGHSDADVLLHAICDGLLGAMGEGDIGKHFPNHDPKYKGISSLQLLKMIASMVAERNCTIENIDSTVVAEQPMIGPYIPQMIEKIAGTLKISRQRINIKATTSEGLGFVGEGKGIVAHAMVLLSWPLDNQS
jgi:2-C-methyl-D-erythritol 2,4-cyclodiphosphate synthase